jgi:ectoine hydroxylase-related dioxygenase (phytanoyl-CoA dioxygenase family)
MPIASAAIREFGERGYTTVPDMFTPGETAAMVAELERFKREGLLRNVATDGDGTTTSATSHNLQICPIHPRSRFYRALPFHPKVVGVVGALIGDPFVFYLDQIFLKPARTGAGTGWHQDNAYFKVADPTKGVGMWVALHDATVANGTMHVIPGSHLDAFAHERDPGSDHHIRMEADESKAVPVELPAGGALFFNFGVAHCTKANTTDRERAGLALHFLNAGFIPGERRWPPATPLLSGPDADGGKALWGEDLRGAWPGEVDRVLA